MSRIHKTDFYPFAYLYLLLIPAWYKILQNPHCIFCGINRHNRRYARTLALTVLPLRFKFLDMRTVKQHDLAELLCCLCCINTTFEPLIIQ